MHIVKTEKERLAVIYDKQKKSDDCYLLFAVIKKKNWD
jgi:hypothetical protein